MKILIIGNFRSGSTTLFNAFYKSMDGHKGFSEPFNFIEDKFGDPKSTYSLNYPNLIVKILFWDLLYSKPLPFTFINKTLVNNFLTFNDLIPYIIDDLSQYSLNFDRTIIIKRQNEIESAKSLSASSKNRQFHSPYTYDNTQHDYSISLNSIVTGNNILQGLSTNLNIPLTYYEDIYSGNIIKIEEFLEKKQIKVDNFNLFCEILNPKYRYRQN
jgi:hypothetical protein